VSTMTEWLFTCKAWAVGALLLIGAAVLAVVFREGTLGNVASIVGLAVSVLGFVVTIWTVLDARQQIKESAKRAEEAIAQARAEARRTIARIATQLRAADCAALRSGVEDLRQAALDSQWARAVYRCQECRVLAYRLAPDQHLTAAEASALRSAADDLQLIRRFIEKNRMEGQLGSLQERQIERLDSTIALLAQIQARLHHESLRPTEAPSDNP
jgi:hypothetical protein